MQGIVYMPDGHLQTGSPPPNKNSVSPTNMEISSDINNKTKEILKQFNQSDSGILSATGLSTITETDKSQQMEIDDTEEESTCSSPDRKYLCPICETMLTSQHEFTIHIRSHNNETEVQDTDKGFTCRICSKVLSSSASLDRHVLIHSGERPFTCSYCGDTFTTNGNMHRHMRTHTNKAESYESDGNSDSGASTSSKNIEYNNNKISEKLEGNRNLGTEVNDKKRKMVNLDLEQSKKLRMKLETSLNTKSRYTCPVCDRSDFDSIDMIEMHLEDNHPDYPAKCNYCGGVFTNNRLLNEHKSMVHVNEETKLQKNSVVGFKDLTFVDFSSQKFPIIARYECEKNLHKVVGGLKFQCSKCARAFPCASSLKIHESSCTVGLDLTFKSKNSNLPKPEKDLRRNDFFARLDLQNNAQDNVNNKRSHDKSIKLPLTPTVMSDTRDLADIQSIISLTSNGTLLQQLQDKSNEASCLRSKDIDQENSKHEHEEESQDLFAAEFRKMKLRGEFPCRLCTAVFPNLRALKGHNRAHLNGNSNGIYTCNMCPHTSVDKAALIRHMRTHNGDRPYECSVCNYAFTTKANCERHLRNRHSKSTREEVKKSIIYHPSEDPSNEEISKMLAKEENRLNLSKTSTDNSSEKNDHVLDQYVPTPDIPSLLTESITKDHHPAMTLSKSLANSKISSFPFNENFVETKPEEKLPFSPEQLCVKNDHLHSYVPQFSFSPNPANTSTPQKPGVKINVKNLKTMIEYDNDKITHSESSEAHSDPMDQVLDLSTKKTERKNNDIIKETIEDAPEDLSNKNVEPTPHNNMTDILAHQLLKNTPKIDPASLYASQLAFCRNGGLPALPALSAWPFPLNPLLFPTMTAPFIPQDPQQVKERLQRFQLCGGDMIMNNFAERLKSFHQQSLNNVALNSFNNFKLNDIKQEVNTHEPSYSNHVSMKPEDIKPLTLSIDQNLSENLMKMQSPISLPKSEPTGSPNSVKMVIKNGVLMPKQKQRRYRTERPFSCEYCSARFTLRSNMERHIKQQHPQYWSQRQRLNVGNGGRKSQSGVATTATTPTSTLPPTMGTNYCSINIPNYEGKHADYDDAKDPEISDKVKYTLLAQHLKAAQKYASSNKPHIKNQEDEDYPLVIDENDENGTKKDEQRGSKFNNNNNDNLSKMKICAEKIYNDCVQNRNTIKNEDVQDLVPVSRLLDNASQQPFKEYFRREGEGREGFSEEDEEGLVASSSTSEENNSGTDENRSESENAVVQVPMKKKSAYSLAPNRVSCPYCQRKFPWTSSLRRHVLTHTGQKPFKCSQCPLLFTTKSNCDRHLLRKHGNNAIAISNDMSANHSNYMMRNVPERPFKCSSCPSSTFSTYSNLKKHISCKHTAQNAQSDDARSQVSTGYEAGSSEDEKMPHSEQKGEWDKQVLPHKLPYSTPENQNNHLQNSELPFKCHLCDNSFAERSDALEHIKEKHSSEYDLLMSKNALDMNATGMDENTNHEETEENEVRGKFPDYANRKVICAFCMRRFWSAEDLRRHMRTHTGERPFSCDVCHRRFTLKHSMLRHRKKHNISFENDNVNSDEDINNACLSTSFGKFVKGNNNNNHLVSKSTDKPEESDGTESSDLISNLLGIRDRSIIDQVLTSSADDAAKILGVKSSE